MWDGYEERGTSKPYIWIAFFLLLLVMSSIFFLRPSISGLPSGDMPASGNAPVVSPIEQRGPGEPLYMANGSTGAWSVRETPTGVYISYLDGLGVELWGESLTVDSPLIASRGAYLVVGSFGQGTLVVYHSRNQQLLVKQIPAGQIQAVSVSETGETVVAYSSPSADPLALKTNLTHITSLGHELWTASLPGVEVIGVSQAADSSLCAALGIRVDDARAKTIVTAFGSQGVPLFSQDLEGRPVGVVVRADGGAVAVATGRTVFSLDKEGVLQWEYDSGAEISRLSYVGLSPKLLFTAHRRSLLTLGLQESAGVIAETGKLVWQYRTRERIVWVDTASISTNILVATGRRLNLYSPDGQERWTLPHSFGDIVRTATVDGKSYIVQSSGQDYFLRGN